MTFLVVFWLQKASGGHFWFDSDDGKLMIARPKERRRGKPFAVHRQPPVSWSASKLRPSVESMRGIMAAKRKSSRRSKSADLIISKSRTKGAAKKCNVGGEFYEALDKVVRDLIKNAEGRAIGNKRKTLKAVDL